MPLDVIGAGFGRTGTLSLKEALNMIGFGPCYHMSEVLRNPKAPGHWAALARGEQVDWDLIFDGYRSAVDWPACTYWKEMADYYPAAKVILTERDPDKWFDSTRKTIFSDAHIGAFLTPDADPEMRAMMDRLYTRTFDGKGHERAHATAVFKAHAETVKAALPPERLLVFNVAEGWAPLCDFLGAPVPDTPFPHVNTAEDWLNR